MTRAFATLVARDLRLALTDGADAALAVIFFALTAILFPFAVGPEPGTLANIAPGVLWVAALLAQLLALERLYAADHADGSLDLLLLGPLPPALIALAKTVAHWLVTGLPLIVATPILALIYGLPGDGLLPLAASVALGTPVLSLVGGIGAALILGARRAGVLLALLVLPLYIPPLIFGAAAVEAALAGLPMRPHLLALSAMAAAALSLAPLAAGAALSQAVRR